MAKEKAFSIRLRDNRKFTRLFGSSSKTKGLRSGCVVLRPGESVDWHNTGASEEALVILSGRARISCGPKYEVNVDRNSFVYIPGRTLHNVTNIGRTLLKYVYVAAPA